MRCDDCKIELIEGKETERCSVCKAIRADERRKVEAEIVEWLRAYAEGVSSSRSRASLEAAADNIEDGEHRPTGQRTGTAEEK